jgi:hypothetical protein
MDRVTQRLRIDRVVLLVDAGNRMCCRRSGHDHRPVMITKAHKRFSLHIVSVLPRYQGTPERAGSRPGGPIQDHLQLITAPASAHAAAPSDGAESMIDASVSADGRVAGRLPIRADPKNHPP